MSRSVYVWKRIEHATGSYHESGGLLVVAETEDRARELAISKDVRLSPEEKFDHCFPCAGEQEEIVLVFPDAGCC
jgi:hypothetical protein